MRTTSWRIRCANAPRSSGQWAATDRGWLFASTGPCDEERTCLGHYLDYGPDHYRTPHEQVVQTVHGPQTRVFCVPGDRCPTCEPGSVHAVVTRSGGGPRSHWFRTPGEAREWIESETARLAVRASA